MNILTYSINLLKRTKSAERTVDDNVANWSWTRFKGTLQEGGQLAVTGSFHNLKHTFIHILYLQGPKFFSQICGIYTYLGRSKEASSD